MSRLPATLATVALAAACGSHAGGGTLAAPNMQPTGDRQVRLILFRDAALVHERWRVPLVDGRGAIEVPLDAGITIDDLAVLSIDGARLIALGLRTPGPATGDQVTVGGRSGQLKLVGGYREGHYDEATGEYVSRLATDVVLEQDDHTLHVIDAHGLLEYHSDDTGAARAAITLAGTGAEAWIELSYATPRIAWSAAYALIRDAGGGRATLDGAVAIDNRSGVAFPGAAVTVIDNAFDASRTRSATELARSMLGTTKSEDKGAGRELGLVDVERGQTRLSLAAAPHPLALKEILVFDPIGTRYDSPGSTPQKARNHGLDGKPATTVLRSFEIQLDEATRRNMPAGPVRLFGRGDNGELAPLGAGRLFDRAQGEAKSATVPVGRSPDVKARRQRTDFFIDETGVVDDKGKRTRRMIVEEFTITIENASAHSVEVLVREHMYRGETWKIAYSSEPLTLDDKEGPQQLAFRVAVPAAGKNRVVYRVVYDW